VSSDALKAIIVAISCPQAQARFNSWSFTDLFFFLNIVLAFYAPLTIGTEFSLFKCMVSLLFPHWTMADTRS